MGEDMEKDRLIRFLLLLIVLCEPLCQPLIAYGVEGHIVKDDWTAKAVRSGYIPLQQRRTTAQKNSRHGTGIQSALRNGGEQAMDIGVCLPVNNFSGILIDMDSIAAQHAFHLCRRHRQAQCAADLLAEGFHGVELPLVAQEVRELDADALSVEVAGEMEDVALDRNVLTADGRARADVCDGGVLPIRQDDARRINAAARDKHMALNQSVPLDTPFFDPDSYTSGAQQLASRDPEDLLIDRERARSLLSGVRKQLSEFEAKILGYYLDGLSCREIAETAGISPKSVDNAVQRIRRKTAQQLLSGDFSGS